LSRERILFRRWIRIVLATGSIIFLLCTVSALYIYAYGQTDHAQQADVIIILGAGVEQNGKPDQGTIRRARHGAALYNKGLAPYILCTGGFVSNPQKSEASACKEILLELNIPESAILLEEKSNSTEENAIESRIVMDAKQFKTAVLVSDNFHLLRAEMLFHNRGMTVYPSPAQVTSGTLDLYWGVLFTYREVAAFIWHGLKSALHLPYTSSPL
jgi:uncharacterized SAM-binding protein YcdF (DUF218 family)